MIPSETIKSLALEAGFDLAGVTTADPLESHENNLLEWIQRGFSADMAYMSRMPQRRARPTELLSSAKSVIVLGLNYYSQAKKGPHSLQDKNEGMEGRISRYAWGKDYHSVFEDRLRRFEGSLRNGWGNGLETRWYVDYGPVLEKAFAQQAGLGFIGKNTLLITSPFGSWIFLAAFLTNLEIEPNEPMLNQCGTCRLCLDACPTGALVGPFELDARRCISYLTIENKGSIDPKIRPLMENWVFGCDICQEVCPYNAHPVETKEKAFHLSEGVGPFLSLKDLFSIETEHEFKNQFHQTPLLRSKRKGLLRNAAVALENQNEIRTTSLAREALEKESDPLVKTHLDWSKDPILNPFESSSKSGGGK